MATFPSYNPTYPITKKSEPKIRTVKFGDGYSQRLTFGLNQNPKVWSPEFILRPADADIVEAFLDARALDGESFDWTPPGSAAPLKWICPSWEREVLGPNSCRLQTTFTQVFEP